MLDIQLFMKVVKFSAYIFFLRKLLQWLVSQEKVQNGVKMNKRAISFLILKAKVQPK